MVCASNKPHRLCCRPHFSLTEKFLVRLEPEHLQICDDPPKSGTIQNKFVQVSVIFSAVLTVSLVDICTSMSTLLMLLWWSSGELFGVSTMPNINCIYVAVKNNVCWSSWAVCAACWKIHLTYLIIGTYSSTSHDEGASPKRRWGRAYYLLLKCTYSVCSKKSSGIRCDVDDPPDLSPASVDSWLMTLGPFHYNSISF